MAAANQVLQPTGAIKAKLVFIHGFSDHISRYGDFFKLIAAQGVQVLAWDQRGWGKSVTKPSEKGLTGPTSRVNADIAAFLGAQLPSDVPVFVMGHSMGGGEALTFAGDEKYKDLVGQVRGWLLEAPFIGFTPAEEPSSIKVAMGRLVGKLLPSQQMKHVVPHEYLSRDPAVGESVKNDALCHDTGTLEGLASLLDRTGVLSSKTVKLGDHVRAVWLAHGTDDKICSFDKAMAWLDGQEGIADREKRSYEGAYHQLHADTCKDEFLKDLLDFINKRSTPEGQAVEAKL